MVDIIGINPNAPVPTLNQGGGFFNRLQTGLNSPLFQFGTNLLAASGPQPGFRTFGQTAAQAFDLTRQQQQSSQMQDLQRRLIEARIAQLQAPAQAPTPLTDIGRARRDLQAGNITEEEFDQITGAAQEVPEFSNVEETPGGGFIGLNKSTGKIEAIPSDITGTVTGAGTQKQIDNTNKLIDNVKKDKRVDDFIQVSSSFDRVNAASANAAGDLSLMFSFMKMLDPGSVVREGEQALARNAAGVPERIRTTYNNILAGESLSPAQRAEFKGEARRVFDASRDRARIAVDPVKARAQRIGLRPETIEEAVFELEPEQAAEGVGAQFTPGQRVTQDGNIFEVQPDGTFLFVGTQ